ncbi:MAG TPA: SGNH/GDSL hydrolase family protein [Mizugakiibacter sp.]
MAEPRLLALGDSYTIGEGVEEAGRWPMQLAARLHGEGIAVAEPAIVATTGWTTDELAAAMDAASFAPPYALVTLLIGVNNQYRGRDLDEYRSEFRALLARAIALAGGDARRALVVSIPDWGVTPFARGQGRDAGAIAAAIDAFNAVNRAEAAAQGVAWVDVTDLSRDRGDSTAMLATDGLHPSAAQYARWVERILPAARRALAQSR